MDRLFTTRSQKPSIKIFIIFFFSLFLAHCARSSPDPSTLSVGIEADADQLDPRLATDAISSKINRLLYNGLLKIDESLNLTGDLAEEFRFDSPTRLSLTLKKGVHFHDGSELTTEDVLATINSVREARVISPFKASFDQIRELRALDDHRLEIELHKPFAPFLTSLLLPILPSQTVDGDFRPIGTGAYQLIKKVPREKIVLEAFSGYFDGAPAIRNVVFHVITDDTLRVLDLIKGRLDLVQNAIPPPLIPALLDKGAWYKPPHVTLRFNSIPGINVAYLGFNLKNPYLKDMRVRRAMAHALDRAALIHYKLKGQATPAASLLNPGHWAHHAQLPGFEFDPELAKKYLDEAGFQDPDGDGPRPRFTLTYKTSTRKDRIEMAELIASQLGAVGIQVQVKPFEWGIFYRDIRQGDFELFSLSWVGITDPDIFYYAFHSSQIPPQGANRGFYRNDKLDALLMDSQSELDPPRRREILIQIQDILAHDLPILPLWFENNYAAYNSRLKDFKLRLDAGFQGILKATLDR